MAERSEREKALSSDISAKTTGTDAFGQRHPVGLNHDWYSGLILVLAVILAYQPVWHAGFNWDDDTMVTANPCIVGPLGLKEIWTTSAADICPLTLTTFWLEHALWGLAPLPYHLVNVLMHAACAVLLWRVLRHLRIPGAQLGAALWALHPVQVESVAWISEMKNTQSCLFYLLTILFYVRWLKARGPGGGTGAGWNYGFTLLFASLAMASKSSTVILPVVLGLCAWWMEGRWQWRHLVRLAPLLLMSIAAVAISMWTQALQLATDTEPQWVRTWPERLVAAGDAVWFYLGKLLWPHPLITIYPRWQIDAAQWFSYLPLLFATGVLFLLWLKRESWSRPWFFAFAYFLAALLPVLGLADNTIFRSSLVFDHFQYLAGMGPLALAGAGLVKLAACVIPKKPWLQSSLCAVPLLALGMLSWQRAWVYESLETLWADTLARNPTCWVGYNNLGAAFLKKGRVDEAVGLFQKALKLNPNVAPTYNNLGIALFEKGRLDEAIDCFQKALELNPKFALVHVDLGVVLSDKGQVDEAIVHYQKAVELNPISADAYDKLGLALIQKGRLDEAISQFQKALEIDPNLAEAHYNLGGAFFQKGRVDEAMALYQKALELNPNYADAHFSLGVVLLQKGRLDDAMTHFQKVLEIRPDHAETCYYLGAAFFQKGQMDEATTYFQKALAVNPNYAEADNGLGNVFLQKGQIDESMVYFQKALLINPKIAEVHDSLGAALAQKGRLDEAVVQFRESLRLDPGNSSAQNNLAKAQAMMRQKAVRP